MASPSGLGMGYLVDEANLGRADDTRFAHCRFQFRRGRKGFGVFHAVERLHHHEIVGVAIDSEDLRLFPAMAAFYCSGAVKNRLPAPEIFDLVGDDKPDATVLGTRGCRRCRRRASAWPLCMAAGATWGSRVGVAARSPMT